MMEMLVQRMIDTILIATVSEFFKTQTMMVFVMQKISAQVLTIIL